MAKAKKAQPTGATESDRVKLAADGWYEALTPEGGTVRAVELDPQDTEPISMPILDDPAGLERQPKRPPSDTFTLREGMSSEPSEFLIASSAAPETRPVSDVRTLPYSAAGKLLTQVPGGVGHGTAFVLGYRLVFTAAHCVVNGHGVDYIPYFNGSSPGSRRWKMKYWFIHNQYMKSGSPDYRYDLAICITDPADDPIMPTTGNLGWLSVPHGQQECLAIGYPMSPPKSFNFDGNRMWSSRGAFLRSDSDSLSAARNEMTQGCSGGPWVINLGSVGGWRAVGLNSHVRNFSDNIMYSPTFDEDFHYMIEAARKKEREFNGSVAPGDPNYVRFV
jgi:V8-like Glu-specific endopeptidase